MWLPLACSDSCRSSGISTRIYLHHGKDELAIAKVSLVPEANCELGGRTIQVHGRSSSGQRGIKKFANLWEALYGLMVGDAEQLQS